MAYENIITPAVGTPMPVDLIGSARFPRTKIAWGAEGVANETSDATPMPIVDQALGAKLPASLGAKTAAASLSVVPASNAVFAGNSDPANDVFEIAPNDAADLASPIRVLDVLAAGNVSFVTVAGQTRNFTSIPAGYSFRCRIARVRATGTTSTKLLGYV